ncbi:MAG: 4-hydroxy-tetrahydrodipicolinate reductase [Bacilli bacterium]|nr:4-hydroxy-tetrahydrodipicolinate reductase [Bacilli bacterium]
MNILLSGANGNMGREVQKALKNNMKVVAGFDRDTSDNGLFPVYDNINDIKEDIDVIIDFSVPKATLEVLKYAQKNNTPIVIATTGFSEEELNIIENYSKELPIFKSSNMSFDINLMTRIVTEVAEALKESDIEIIETHHNRKIDSPSGTAILLADAINKVFNNEKEYTFDRMQKREKRQKKEIGFSSIRGGNIVGEHTVSFFGENESLEITHKAYSRGVFAEGALKAAEFIIGKQNGLYDMKDLLK